MIGGSFSPALAALPAGVAAAPQKPQPAAAGVRVAAGNGRFNQILRLPGGGQLFIKVSAQDTAGAFLLTEQPSAGKGGPPKHFHRDEDEWFYCLEGRYIVEVGDQRFELNAGDSVLGPRRVPHAFAFIGDTPGRLLVGFPPPGAWSSSFAISRHAASISVPAPRPTGGEPRRSTASSTSARHSRSSRGCDGVRSGYPASTSPTRAARL